jgi:hypothetical protein
MFFRNRRKERGEDLNRKVESYRKWWQEGTGDLNFQRSNRPKDKADDRRASDSCFVYYEES